jgi:serine/threonine-protein kinase
VTEAEVSASGAGWRIGQIVAGKYRILGLLGSGGMGEVYEALHQSIDRRFAIKFLREEHKEDVVATERFAREARLVGSFECEHIVSVIDTGKGPDGAPYLIMERLRGDDLKSLLKIAHRLSVRRATRIAVDVCRGLSVAHRAGLIHRDLKPANLFLCRHASGEEYCKILDFGIARKLGSTTTAATNVVGTARYMAPEQIQESGALTAAADLYSLGAILYECLSGVCLHPGETIQAVLFNVIHEEPRPLSEVAPDLPEELCKVVHRALAKKPKDRYQSAAEFEAALRSFAERAEVATPASELSDTSSTIDASVQIATGRSSVSRELPARTRWARSAGVLALCLALAGLSYRIGSASVKPAQDRLVEVVKPAHCPELPKAPSPSATAAVVPTPAPSAEPPVPTSNSNKKQQAVNRPTNPRRKPDGPAKAGPFLPDNPYLASPQAAPK